MQPYTLDSLYGGSLHRRMDLAKRLFADHGNWLLSHTVIPNSLDLLLNLENEMRRCMAESGLPAFCRTCAHSSKTGGCCSHAMTDENDAVLLLLNLLVGQAVELQSYNGSECLFLGLDGCTLRFKPFFCLNYLCRKLHHRLQAATLKKITDRCGRLLQEQYATEQKLLQLLTGIGVMARITVEKATK